MEQATSEVVTREEAEALCGEFDRALRSLFGDQPMPPEWEAQLDAVPLDGTARRAVFRFSLLRGYYIARQSTAAARAHVVAADRNAILHDLVEATPVEVPLRSGRKVQCTERSWLAIMNIASHQLRIRWLDSGLQRIAEDYAALEPVALKGAPDEAAAARAQLKVLVEEHQAGYEELARQRMAMYAHCFTPDGKAATPETPPPVWWEEITPSDDVVIIAGLVHAGHGRWHALGPVPPRKHAEGERLEDFGFQALLYGLERNLNLPMASLKNERVFQRLSWVRASADPEPPVHA